MVERDSVHSSLLPLPPFLLAYIEGMCRARTFEPQKPKLGSSIWFVTMAISADLLGPRVLPFKKRNQNPLASCLTDDVRRLSEVVKKSTSTGKTIWVCGGRTREAQVPCLDGFVGRNRLSELRLRLQPLHPPAPGQRA